jgi:hypothetical protein
MSRFAPLCAAVLVLFAPAGAGSAPAASGGPAPGAHPSPGARPPAAVHGAAPAGRTSPAPHVTRMGVNLLANPGFEEPLAGHPWMPADWDTSDSGLPTVYFGRDTSLAHGGHYSVNVANTNTTYPVWHNWFQTVLVGPEAWDKDVVFSAWTRANGVQGRAYILVQAYKDSIGRMSKLWGMDRDATARKLKINSIDDPLLDLGWKRQYFSGDETEWVQRTVRTYVPPGVNVIYVRCGLLGTGQLMVDDASLTLEPAEPAVEPALNTNLVTDPGFEGDGNDWEYAMPAFELMRVERDTTMAHQGKASLLATGGMNGFMQVRAGVCRSFCNRALAGKRVRIAGWFRTDSLKSVAYLKIYAHTGHGMVQSNAPLQQFSNTTPWSPSSLEMDLPPDTYEVWAWWLYNAPAPGMIHVDDCSFEVLGPAGSAAATPAGPATPAKP